MDSRAAERGAAVRRRRECRSCRQRYSTYERPEQAPLAVRKRSGTVEPYDRRKVLLGIAKATNLPVEADTVVRAAARVEGTLRDLGVRVVGSDTVGTEVLAVLRELDTGAYMRFASVYKGLTSPDDFRRELASLDKDAPPKGAEA